MISQKVELLDDFKANFLIQLTRVLTRKIFEKLMKKAGTFNLLGRYYPFFLDNTDLFDAPHYLYQIYSPGLDAELDPYFSITKVSEKTTEGMPTGTDLDLLKYTSKRDVTESSAINFIKFLMKREKLEFEVVENGKNKFPKLEILETPIVQKALIVDLRDYARWRNYKFIPGRFIDILWTTGEFLVCEFCEDEKDIWLEPRSLHKVTDTALNNPLKVDVSNIDFNVEKWHKSEKVAFDISRVIRAIEWGSFSRKIMVR